jgi:DNA-binding response OmpR family regulator
MPTPDLRLLVADQDPQLRLLLLEHLGRSGFQVDSVASATALGHWLRQREPALLVLDQDLPGSAALGLLQQVHRLRNTPVILVSRRDDPRDRIGALDSGADDYLVKPFEPDELLARIRAVLRRYREPCRDASGKPDRFVFGPYLLDRNTLELRRDDRPVPLTAGEMDLLLAFADHPGRVLGRERLLDLVRGAALAPLDRSIDVQVARLRAKLETRGRPPRFIRTVWGRGYRFTPEGD